MTRPFIYIRTALLRPHKSMYKRRQQSRITSFLELAMSFLLICLADMSSNTTYRIVGSDFHLRLEVRSPSRSPALSTSTLLTLGLFSAWIALEVRCFQTAEDGTASRGMHPLLVCRPRHRQATVGALLPSVHQVSGAQDRAAQLEGWV